MGQPVAFFLTFTPYGNRLHGDGRGTVDRNNNLYGSPFLSEDRIKKDKRRKDMAQPPLYIDAKLRGGMHNAIHQHAEFRGWYIHALNIRSNHIHLVVTSDATADVTLNQFKAYTTRHLRGKGLVSKDRKVWARGGSKRKIWNEDHLRRACWYTLHSQGPDLPMDWRDASTDSE